MLNAAQARAKTINDILVFNEIRELEAAILQGIQAGVYTISVNGTTMTSTDATVPPVTTANPHPVAPIATSRLYFQVWQGTLDDRAKFIQMSNVITYFTDLGYTIQQLTNTSTGSTFNWTIYW
jgi:hypothetical protein